MPDADLGIAQVVLPVPVDGPFDYAIPAARRGSLRPGQRVRVPFGRRRLWGICVGLAASSSFMGELRPVDDLPDSPSEAPALDDELLQLARRIAEYYGCSWGEALDAALPAWTQARGLAARERSIRLALDADAARRCAGELRRRAPAQARLLEHLVLAEPLGLGARALCDRAGAGAAPLRELLRKGWAIAVAQGDTCLPSAPQSAPVSVQTPGVAANHLRLQVAVVGPDRESDRARGFEAQGIHFPGPKGVARPPEHLRAPVGDLALSADQRVACEAVAADLAARRFRTHVLLGVTGSGKTEVYIELIGRCLAAGRGALVLVPEIALTPQTLARFAARFPSQVAALHSRLTDVERARAWRRIASGEARVAIGPRSVVFAPLRDLGLIVVDEEHESSFKQDRSPRYHGRDAAILRAQGAGAVALLGSATPALESYHHALEGKYGLLRLPERVCGALPRVEILDLAEHADDGGRTGLIAPPLYAAIETALRDGLQALLLRNRRGFAACLMCRRCRQVHACPRCDAAFTVHRRAQRCLCHHCGEVADRPAACAACGSTSLLELGAGTERVEDVVQRLFPRARVARLDTDSVSRYADLERVLSAFGRREIDILVGTQMIAKGHDFPGIAVVGVLEPDLALGLPDFRAAERGFQLLAQVAGRAGRSENRGRVFIQTWQADHPVYRFVRTHDYEGFARHELAARKRLGYPPYGRLLRVVLRGRDPRRVDELAAEIAGELRRKAPERVLGPAPCALARLRGLHRRHLLVKAPDAARLREAVQTVRPLLGRRKGVEGMLDVDPQGML